MEGMDVNGISQDRTTSTESQDYPSSSKSCIGTFTSTPASARLFEDSDNAELPKTHSVCFDRRRLQEELAPLRSKPLSPIAWLPVEILTMIFVFLPVFNPNKAPWQSGTLPACLAVSQVSQLWRRVALGFKPLWTAIPMQCKLWTAIALERSRPAPIVLDIQIFPSQILPTKSDVPRFLETMPLALAELPRTCELTIELDLDPFLLETLPLLERSPAPYLEYLRIVSDGGWYDSLPNNIFSGVTPMKLRTLELHQCCIHPSAPLFRAPLTYLELESSMEWPSLDVFIETFKALPSLRTLALRSEDFSSLDDPTPSVHKPRSIDLPNLTFLTIVDGVKQVAVMLKYLTPPPDAILDITCVYHDEDNVEQVPAPSFISDVREAFSHHFAAAVAAGLSFCNVTFDSAFGFEPAGFAITASMPCTNSTIALPAAVEGASPPSPAVLPPRIKFSHYWPQRALDPEDSHAMTFLPELLSSLPAISGARAFYVFHPSAFRLTHDWAILAACMPQLHTICVHRNAAHGLVAAMATHDPGVPFLPMLKALDIRSVDFSDTSGEHLSLFSGLVLGTRASRRAPLDLLSIFDCDVTHAMFEVLRTNLGQDVVIWDGVVDAVTRAKEAARREDHEMMKALESAPGGDVVMSDLDSDSDSGQDE
ncbi:hypothetical protein BV25DRAFT_1897693 [Artomyces pyxidatus]|uniref:Uncharacterized protein n=1 Tax=Artomyces pyxidatus TaxID=48021 RepID=A0ACB8TCI7_9AGAM|nr:hypothetical protein BV25DRAFT_1897693 [Artomyces pyxidatus]